MIATGMTELRISDDYLDAHVGDNSNAHDIDVLLRTPTEAFDADCLTVPRSGSRGEFNQIGVKVNNTAADEDAVYAWINRRTKNNPSVLLSRYTCAQMHPESIHTIRPYGTTARGISIFS
jgi:hypothetical protein